MRRLPHLLLSALLLFACSPAATPCDRASFDQFWSTLHGAAVEGDVGRVQQSVSFPFETRGPMDGDPIVRHDAASFPQLWAELLAMDPGLELEPETMREYIARHQTAPPDAVDVGGDEARVADLVFSCRQGSWQMTMAYTSE